MKEKIAVFLKYLLVNDIKIEKIKNINSSFSRISHVQKQRKQYSSDTGALLRGKMVPRSK